MKTFLVQRYFIHHEWMNLSLKNTPPPIFACEQCCSNKTDLSIFLPLLMTAHSRDQRGHRYLNILFLIILLENTNKLPHSFHHPFQWNLLLKGMLDYEMRQFGTISKIFISKFMFSSYGINFKTDTISMYKFYLWETGKHFRKVNFPLSTDTLRVFFLFKTGESVLTHC